MVRVERCGRGALDLEQRGQSVRGGSWVEDLGEDGHVAGHDGLERAGAALGGRVEQRAAQRERGVLPG